MRVQKGAICLVLLIGLLLPACDSVQIGYKPYGIPLGISIDTHGQISFSVEKEIEYPTLLGSFSIGLVTNPAKYFGVKNTLTVRFNGEDHIYDLHGRDFDLRFEPGCYKKINLSKSGGDLFLELERICPVTLEIDNQSSVDICCVHISPCGSESWGNCWLASNEIIPIGRNRVFSLAPGCYDLLIVNCDGSRACERHNEQIYDHYI